MEETKTYEVLDVVTIEGIEYAVGDIISLPVRVADLFVSEGKLKLAGGGDA